MNTQGQHTRSVLEKLLFQAQEAGRRKNVGKLQTEQETKPIQGNRGDCPEDVGQQTQQHRSADGCYQSDLGFQHTSG